MASDGEDDILAHMALPESHRRRIHSTNPLERLNAELKRRSKVVGGVSGPGVSGATPGFCAHGAGRGVAGGRSVLLGAGSSLSSYFFWLRPAKDGARKDHFPIPPIRLLCSFGRP
ncbi:MAG TPA: hypothetical protein DCM14_08905 [Clostridiales bacterium UBA8153]|nr:hypothetical protein [Clostridiales bacterium UBA8153]